MTYFNGLVKFIPKLPAAKRRPHSKVNSNSKRTTEKFAVGAKASKDLSIGLVTFGTFWHILIASSILYLNYRQQKRRQGLAKNIDMI